MSNNEKELLFGELVSGRISAEDRRRLMAAALTDQALFDAIAEQEEIAELMAEPLDWTAALEGTAEERTSGPAVLPAAMASAPAPAQMPGGGGLERARKAAAPAPPTPPRRFSPMVWTGAGAVAMLVFSFLFWRASQPASPEKVERAAAEAPKESPAAAPAAEPAQAPATPAPKARRAPAPKIIELPAQRASEPLRDLPAPPEVRENAPGAGPVGGVVGGIIGGVPRSLPPAPPAAAPPPAAPAPAPVLAAEAEGAPRPAVQAFRAPAEPVEIYRREASGRMVHAGLDTEFAAGEALEIRVRAPRTGMVALVERVTLRVRAQTAATAGALVTLPLVAEAGDMDLVIRFLPPAGAGGAAQPAARAKTSARPAPAGALPRRQEISRAADASTYAAPPAPAEIPLRLKVR